MHFKGFFVSVLLLISVSVGDLYADDRIGIDTDDIKDIDTGKYEDLLEDIPIEIGSDMENKARDAIPENLNERVQKEMERLKGGVFSGTKEYEEYQASVHEPIPSLLKDDERIYIFISSSIPVDTLRNYAVDLDVLGDPKVSMVMRGFVGGMQKIKPTIEFIWRIIVKVKGCNPYGNEDCGVYNAGVLIDPFLFRRYGIDRVPAVVHAKEVTVRDSLSSEGLDSATDVSDYYVLYGDTALDGALEAINRGVKAGSLDCLIHKLRRGEVSGRVCQ